MLSRHGLILGKGIFRQPADKQRECAVSQEHAAERAEKRQRQSVGKKVVDRTRGQLGV
jgi:hypothetical protein